MAEWYKFWNRTKKTFKKKGFDGAGSNRLMNDFVGGNYITAFNIASTLPKLLPNSQNIDFSIFLDAANVWAVDYSSSVDDSNKIRSSTGAAINWISPIGPMSFILSTNLSKAKTDETQSFTFNLGTTF